MFNFFRKKKENRHLEIIAGTRPFFEHPNQHWQDQDRSLGMILPVCFAGDRNTLIKCHCPKKKASELVLSLNAKFLEIIETSEAFEPLSFECIKSELHKNGLFRIESSKTMCLAKDLSGFILCHPKLDSSYRFSCYWGKELQENERMTRVGIQSLDDLVLVVKDVLGIKLPQHYLDFLSSDLKRSVTIEIREDTVELFLLMGAELLELNLVVRNNVTIYENWEKDWLVIGESTNGCLYFIDTKDDSGLVFEVYPEDLQSPQNSRRATISVFSLTSLVRNF